MDGQIVYYHPGSMGTDMPQYYYLHGERRIEQVPRPLVYRTSVQTFPGILYFTRPGLPGVFVKDILKNRADIEGANDPVFEHHGWRSTVVNLEWPGFVPPSIHKNPMHARIDTRRDGQPVTRLQFAQEVCLLLFDFYKHFGKLPLAPGWERWSMNPNTQSIRVTDLVLLSIHYYRNVWVPEFYLY